MGKRFLLGAIAGLGLAIAVMVFLQESQPAGLASLGGDYTVKVGYKPSANYIGLFVALEKGYFEEEGLRIEAVRFDSTNTLMDAFAAGKLDATTTGNVIVSYSLENSEPGLFRLYCFDFYTDERHPESLVARKGSGIESYADLGGRTIGANKGVFARTMLEKFLEKQGVKDFEIIELEDGLQLPALESGQIDALISLEPNPTVAVERGIAEFVEGGSVYARTTGFEPAFSGASVSTWFLEQRPAEAKKFLRAMKKAFRFIAENTGESQAILPKYMPIEDDIAGKIPPLGFVFFEDLGQDQRERIQKTADFLFEEGIIGQRVDTETLLLDSGYLN